MVQHKTGRKHNSITTALDAAPQLRCNLYQADPRPPNQNKSFAAFQVTLPALRTAIIATCHRYQSRAKRMPWRPTTRRKLSSKSPITSSSLSGVSIRVSNFAAPAGGTSSDRFSSILVLKKYPLILVERSE